jgi:hypothetical protein
MEQFQRFGNGTHHYIAIHQWYSAWGMQTPRGSEDMVGVREIKK